MINTINIITINNFLKISDFGLMKNYPIKNLEYNPINIVDIKNNDIIFIKTDYLMEFNELISNTNKSIILISGNSSFIIDDKYLPIVNNNRIIKWYTTNSILKHDKIINIPIGLQNEHLYFHNNPQSDQKLLKSIINTNINKELNVLLSFNVNTNPLHRKPIYDLLSNEDYVDIRIFSSNDRYDKNFMINYYKEIKRHKFVVCPLGTGPDCHRYWEVLYLGTIPIIQKHIALDPFFENDKLPVLYIDKITDINVKLLEYEYNRIKTKKYDLSILDFSYWENKIKKI